LGTKISKIQDKSKKMGTKISKSRNKNYKNWEQKLQKSEN
jgi:hypothetical protein